MIFKKQSRQADRRTHPLIGLLLLGIALFLTLLTVPLGLIFGFMYVGFRRGLTGVGEYALSIAISIDQLGNVIMQHLLNLLWIRKGGYPFGNRDETISSALGRNRKLGTLTGFGKLTDRILDGIDPDHSLNSIDYYIEPRDARKVLVLVIRKGSAVLALQDAGKDPLRLPVTPANPQLADALLLVQMAQTQLGLSLAPAALRFLHHYRVQAASGQNVEYQAYLVDIQDVLQFPDTKQVWLTFDKKHLLEAGFHEILNYLQHLKEAE